LAAIATAFSFNEIHPDYYQIPHADREALLREAEAEEDEHAPPRRHRPPRRQRRGREEEAETGGSMTRTR